jgi:hypothetical protein
MKRTMFAAALLALAARTLCAQTPAAPYAQHLVDMTLASHPELTVLALHVTPPDFTDNIIIASNIGRIGKPADADDLAVLMSGKPRAESTKTGDMSVEVVMHDALGRPIGVIGSTFRAPVGADRERLMHEAQRVHDELAAGIPSLAALFGNAK